LRTFFFPLTCFIFRCLLFLLLNRLIGVCSFIVLYCFLFFSPTFWVIFTLFQMCNSAFFRPFSVNFRSFSVVFRSFFGVSSAFFAVFVCFSAIFLRVVTQGNVPANYVQRADTMDAASTVVTGPSNVRKGKGGTTSTARALWVPGRAWGWQWRGGSCTVGKRRSVRFEWYQIQGGSGSIGGVAVG
jgi:hypothetical protein